MRNAGMRAAVWAFRTTLNVAVGMLRERKFPGVRVTALFSVGMSGARETFGPRSAWARTSAPVAEMGQFASRTF